MSQTRVFSFIGYKMKFIRLCIHLKKYLCSNISRCNHRSIYMSRTSNRYE